MLLVDFISLPTRNRQVSLRLGHAPALTVPRTVIHYRRAAALRVRFRFYRSQGCAGSSPVTCTQQYSTVLFVEVNSYFLSAVRTFFMRLYCNLIFFDFFSNSS